MRNHLWCPNDLAVKGLMMMMMKSVRLNSKARKQKGDELNLVGSCLGASTQNNVGKVAKWSIPIAHTQLTQVRR